MNQIPKTLEEIATEMLVADAKEHNTTLYRMGIHDDRRRWMIRKREVPMSKAMRQV